MSDYTPEMLETINNMEGEWISTDSSPTGKTMKITLSGDCAILKTIKNDEEIENVKFNRNAHWFGSWLCFPIHIDRQFYIRGANAELMVFGEYKGDSIGKNIIWERRFERVN